MKPWKIGIAPASTARCRAPDPARQQASRQTSKASAGAVAKKPLTENLRLAILAAARDCNLDVLGRAGVAYQKLGP